MPDQIRSYLDFEKPVAELDSKVDELRTLAAGGTDIHDEVALIEAKAAQALAELYANLTPWQKTLVARHPQRPHLTDFINALIAEFTPLAGDRKFGEDEALVGGFGRFRGEAICVMGQEKGASTGVAHQAQFRHGAPRRLSQGGAADGNGRALRHSRAVDRGFRGRLSRHRRGRARPGRGDRALDGCLPVARRAQCRDHHRRRHVGRRDRDHHRQPGLDVRARDLQRDLARKRRPRSSGATAPRPRKPPTA